MKKLYLLVTTALITMAATISALADSTRWG